MKKNLDIAIIVIILIVIGCSGTTDPEKGSNAPSNLAATHYFSYDTSWTVNLVWDAPKELDNENFEYRIYKDEQFIETLDNLQNYYTDVDCEFGEEYTYYITAYYPTGESEPSNVEYVTFSPGTGTVTDIDGNVYQTIIFANMEWMSENLKVTHYRNGDEIPNVTDGSQWVDLSTGAYCYYDNDSANGDTYGALYNFYAVDDTRGLAPEGWHVPTDEEIKILEIVFGMSQSEADNIGMRGINEGSKLAGNVALWIDGELENNPEFGSSGFDFLPGGTRTVNNGNFCSLGDSGYFWSSNTLSAWCRILNSESTQVSRYSRSNSHKQLAYSVRCIRD